MKDSVQDSSEQRLGASQLKPSCCLPAVPFLPKATSPYTQLPDQQPACLHVLRTWSDRHGW